MYVVQITVRGQFYLFFIVQLALKIDVISIFHVSFSICSSFWLYCPFFCPFFHCPIFPKLPYEIKNFESRDSKNIICIRVPKVNTFQLAPLQESDTLVHCIIVAQLPANASMLPANASMHLSPVLLGPSSRRLAVRPSCGRRCRMNFAGGAGPGAGGAVSAAQQPPQQQQIVNSAE